MDLSQGGTMEGKVTVRQQIQFIIEGGIVERFHVRPGIKPNTDAHHSFGVAMLCYLMCDNMHHLGMLLMSALTHDLSEQVASDISAPSKLALGISDQLHDFEQAILAKYNLDFYHLLDDQEQVVLGWADAFDGMLYCVLEIGRGNKLMLRPYNKWVAWMDEKQGEFTPIATEIYAAIKSLFEEYSEGSAYDCFE
jgi:5'-deoxynucleotidase YfbR-like HD superfamily hydrolase